MIEILAGLALAATAGLNAYLPLLILAMAGTFGKLALPSPYNLLTGWPAILILLLPVTVELMVDKIPGMDSRNDRTVASLTRPLAGAILFLAYNAAHGDFINPILAAVLGAAAAGAVHYLKLTTRPLVTLATNGYANSLLSLMEDIFAAGVAVLAIFAPVVAIILLIGAVAGLFAVQQRMRPLAAAARERLRQKQANPPATQP